MTPRWARAVGVRPGEGVAVALLALLFAACEAGRAAGEVGADTLVISRFGAEALPPLIVALGLVTLVVALAYGAALGRLPRVPLLAGVLGGAAVLLAVEWAVLASGVRAVVPLAWVTVYAAGALATTLVWTVAGAVFDARQAKRLFPLATAAAIGGGFLGSLAAGPLARLAGAEALLLVEALLLAAAGALVVAVARGGRIRTPPRRASRGLLADVTTGFEAVRRSPLLRLVSVAYVLFAILLFAVSYPFLTAAADAYPDEGDLATVLGLLSATVTAVSFLVSVTLANRLYARIGVAGAALVLPVVYLGGFALWLVSFGFVTAAAVRIAQQVAQRGLSNAAWSAFFNVVPLDRRAQVLAFVDGVPGQVGTVLSGLLLLAAGTVLSLRQAFWLGAVVALVLVVVVVAIRRQYAGSLLRTLRSRAAEQVLEGGPGLAALARDPAVVHVLDDALGSPEAGQRRMAASLLAEVPGPVATRALVGACADPDESVRAAALGALGGRAGSASVDRAVRAGLADPSAAVRAAAVRVSAALPDGARTDVERLAHDPSPDVRAAAASALRAGGSVARAEAVIATLLDGADPAERAAGLAAVRRGGVRVPGVGRALHDPVPGVRVAALHAVAATSDGVEVTGPALAALDDDDPAVRRAAVEVLAPRAAPGRRTPRARRRSQDAVRGPLATWTRARLDRAVELRSARTALTATPDPLITQASLLQSPPNNDSSLINEVGRAAGEEDRAFLVAILQHRERDAVDRALAGLVALGVAGADGVLRRSLGATEPEVRAQAIEALDTLSSQIGDRRITGPLVRLLEDGARADGNAEAVLERLTEGDDPWLALMAQRVLQVDSVGSGTADEGGEPVTSPTVDQVETMLLLRRVPLFAELGPEDLQRVAAGATERSFAAGEAIVREGELGDELVLLLEGTVRIVRADPDGGERLIRHYGPGDHIGELAVLRTRPRAATVVAEGDVRGLVLSGPALAAILRERPDAAMAMLATLAERVSLQ